jgi:hypothetical protein
MRIARSFNCGKRSATGQAPEGRQSVAPMFGCPSGTRWGERPREPREKVRSADCPQSAAGGQTETRPANATLPGLAGALRVGTTRAPPAGPETISQQDQESAENGTQDERDNRPPPRLPITEIQAEGEPADEGSGRVVRNDGRSLYFCFHKAELYHQTLHCARCLPSHLILLGSIILASR